jgi:hypothetical protein
MTSTEYIVNAIRFTKQQNELNGKCDKNGKPYKGLHVVIGKLNDALRMAYGTAGMTAEQIKKLPMVLVQKAVDEGAIVSIPGKLGPTVYLIADAPEGGNRGPAVTSKEQAFSMFGLTPPAVIQPSKAKQAKNASK